MEETIFEIVLGDMEDKIAEGSIEVIIIGMMVTIGVGIDQGRDLSQETIVVIEPEVQITVGQGQDPEPVLLRIEEDAIRVSSRIPGQKNRKIGISSVKK